MAINRNESFPTAIHDWLLANSTDYARLPNELKFGACAFIAWCAHSRPRHRHKVLDGKISISYKTRNDFFGDKKTFESVMGRLGLIEWTNRWSMPGAGRDGWTRGYSLTPAGVDMIADIRAKRGGLMDVNGNRLRKPAQYAIQSRDMSGKSRAGVGNISAVVKVNEIALESLLSSLYAVKRALLEYAPIPDHPLIKARLCGLDEGEQLAWLDRAMSQCSWTLHQIRMDYLPVRSSIEVLYQECSSGRLFAMGASLQSVYREVRYAAFALSGYHEYDLSNAHFDILRQLANKIGLETPAIDNYMADKTAIRARIAADVGISIKEVKVVLLSVLYGAKKGSSWFKSKGRWRLGAIAETVGQDKAARLFEHTDWAGLADEVATIRKPILAACPVHRGKVVNLMGKVCDGGPLSHIVQGVEAKILHCVIETYGNQIVLLQHDGFIASSRLDVDSLSSMVKDRTGFDVTFDEVCLA